MKNEVIVELMGEGGSRALYGVRVADRWVFAMELITQVNPPTTSSGAPVVDSWQAAMAMLDRHSGWYALALRTVHPEFRAALLDAAIERLADPSGASNTQQWRAACNAEATAAVVVTQPVHSSDVWLYDEVEDLAPTDAETERLRKLLRGQGADEATIDRMAPRKSLAPR